MLARDRFADLFQTVSTIYALLKPIVFEKVCLGIQIRLRRDNGQGMSLRTRRKLYDYLKPTGDYSSDYCAIQLA